MDSAKLAQSLAQTPANQHAETLQAAGLSFAATPAKARNDLPPISIWQPQREGDAIIYRRPPSGPMGDHFSDMQHFAQTPDPKCKRLCWFGESAAAGYLFSPHFTPAKCLAHALGMSWEVLDFARTNETLDGLNKTMQAALCLQAHTWVIFTGNNWNLLETGPLSPYTPQAESRFAAAATLAEGGVSQLVEAATYRWFQKASALMADLAIWQQTYGLNIVLIGPAVNRSQWRSWQPLHRVEGRVDTWYRHFEAARVALQDGDGKAAETAALSMLKTSDWLNPSAYDLYAQALRAQGLEEKAETASQAAIDQAHGVTAAHLDSPRAGTLVQTLLQKSAQQHGFGWLDLNQVLTDDAHDFVDYCHLTPAAMHKMADQLCHQVLQVKPSGQLKPDPELLTTGYIGAALHSAHRYLGDGKQPWIAYWLVQALDSNPAAIDRLLDLVAMRLAGGDSYLHPAQTRNLAQTYPLQQQHGWRYAHVDAIFIQSLQQLLQQRQHAKLDQLELLLEQSTWPTGHHNLLRYWLWEPLEQPLDELIEYADLQTHHHLTWLWPRTEFALLLPSNRHIKLHLTLRTPETERGDITIHFEQKALSSVSTNKDWQQITLAWQPTHTKPSLQRLSIRWPLPQQAQPLAETIEKLKQNRDAGLHPIFGQIARCEIEILQKSKA